MKSSKRLVPVFLICVASLSAGSLEFLSIPPTVHGTFGQGQPVHLADALDGLWYNPATLSGLRHTFQVQFGITDQLSIPMLTLGVAFKGNPFQFGLGGAGLFLGEVKGGLFYVGDAGSWFQTQVMRLSGAGSWALHQSFPLPFELTVGAGFHFASEVLDKKTVEGQFLSVGLTAGYRIQPNLSLGLSIDGRMLPWSWKSEAPVELEGSFHTTLSALWTPHQTWSLQGLVGFSHHLQEGSGVVLGMEGRLFERFYLRVGGRLDGNPTLNLSGGVMVPLPGESHLSVDLATLPGRPGSQNLAQLTWAK